MKSCDYCGKESDDELMTCHECGSVLNPPVMRPQAIQASDPGIPPLMGTVPFAQPAPRVLDGARATAILGIYFGGQFIGGIMGGFVAGFSAGIQGHGASYHDVLQQMMPSILFLTMLLGGISVILCGFVFKLQLDDTSPTGPAWVRGSWSHILKGLAIGVALGVLWMVVALQLPQSTESQMGPISRMSVSAGFSRIAWVIVALILAPPTEELLFRGMLYGGYRKSLGPMAAAAITTIIFVALHFTELIYQPLATFVITALALVALALRLHSKAIGPAIAAHFGYNATLVAVMLFSS